MKMVDQSFEWINPLEFAGKKSPIIGGLLLLSMIECAGRTCYKSEDKMRIGDTVEENIKRTKDFVRKMIKSGHHAMIEFAQIPPIRVITNRGVTHEIVRHRLFSYAQESTRYCDYGKDNHVVFIRPVWSLDEAGVLARGYFMSSLRAAETAYKDLRRNGWPPQKAREVLPNALKTEICIAGNAREWRHFFTLRCSPKAHPQMREIALRLLEEFKSQFPVLFDDIYPEEE